MLDLIWEHLELCVLFLLVSQGVVYYRLYLERLIFKNTLSQYKNRLKNNEYAIKSINKYIDDQAMKEYSESLGDMPDLTFYPSDYPSDEDRRISQRRLSNKKGNKRIYDRRCK